MIGFFVGGPDEMNGNRVDYISCTIPQIHIHINIKYQMSNILSFILLQWAISFWICNGIRPGVSIGSIRKSGFKNCGRQRVF
jgi:hypothetical protein